MRNRPALRQVYQRRRYAGALMLRLAGARVPIIDLPLAILRNLGRRAGQISIVKKLHVLKNENDIWRDIMGTFRLGVAALRVRVREPRCG